jgi:uncharacterized membrane protein
MSDAPRDVNPKAPRSHIWTAVKVLVRTRVTTGLIIVLPIYNTFLLAKFVFELMRDSSHWILTEFVRGKWLVFGPAAWRAAWQGRAEDELTNPSPGFQWTLSIVSVIFTIVILYIIGMFARNIFGKRILWTVEYIVDRVPLVKTVYRASKQILASFSGDQSQSFQRVALVPFMDQKSWTLGFITGVFTDAVSGEELVSVFVPTTPNPTSGFMFVLRRRDVCEMTWNTEQSVGMLMSAGIIRPPGVTIVPPAGMSAATAGMRR